MCKLLNVYTTRQVATFFDKAVVIQAHLYTVKKVIIFPVPRRDVINQTLPGQE
jgi:hypothetical protein